MAARLFGGGFASGTVTSVALYSLYAYVLKPSEPNLQLERRKEDTYILPDPGDPQNLLKYGTPDKGPDVRYYSNHALNYDQSKKIPLWVAEHITQADLEGPALRKHSNFVMDPNIPPIFASQNSDYKRSGWSRGHMTPAGDNKHSQLAMDESFYLSNVVPQDINNNMDFWNRLEVYCRNLVSTYKDVWVTTGPLVLPNTDEGGKKYVKYEVIGKNNVAVPTHLYKLITVVLPQKDKQQSDNSSNNEAIAVGAFIVPNQRIPQERTLRDFQVPLENLTESSGLRFFSKLGAGAKIQDLCEVDSCSLMSQKKHQLYFIARRLENATTLHRLEDSWRELEKRNLEPDEYLQKAYKRKKDELEEQAKEKQSKSVSR